LEKVTSENIDTKQARRGVEWFLEGGEVGHDDMSLKMLSTE
jgi:hypothetical protein